MVVDDQTLLRAEPGQMNFTHQPWRSEPRELVDPVAYRLQRVRPSGVEGIDHQVVNVEQQAAAAAPGEFGKKRWLGVIALGEVQIAAEVLDQNGALQPLLHPLHIGAKNVQRSPSKSDGQQIVGMDDATLRPRRAGEAGMVRHPQRIDPLNQRSELFHMGVVKTACRTQRQPHAMQADRIVGANCRKHLCRSIVGVEKVFRVHLDETQGGTQNAEFLVMRLAQADAASRCGLLHGRSPRWFCICAQG